MTGIVQRKRLRQAIDLKNQGRLEGAEKMLSALVAAEPDFATAWLELGYVRLGRGEARPAYAAFARAAESADLAAEAYTALGRLATPGPGDHLRRGNFRKALLVTPSHVPALADLAALADGSVTRWFAVTAASVETGPDPFQDLIRRGNIAPATRLARIVGVVRPGLASVHRNLAVLAFRLEDQESNAAYLKWAATLLPSHLDVLVEATSALFQAEDLDGAERYARRALEIDPSSPLVLFWLGRILRRLGRLDEARARLADALRHDDGFALRIRVVEQGISLEDFTGRRLAGDT